MNRTLLLILCDFLLLTLLALTDWQKAAPTQPVPPPPAAKLATGAGAVSPDEDMVSVMKLSLADERSQRDQVAEQLQATQNTLSEREQSLTATTASLDATRQQAEALDQNYRAVAAEATISKERLAALQRELEQRQAEAVRQAQALEAMEKAQTEARTKIEDLSVSVRVAEQEKQLLRTTAETLQVQVEAERQERIKVQATTTQLAQGVGQLADHSVALTKEIRENRPININVLFNDFLANRVKTTLVGTRPFLLTDRTDKKETRTVFVTDGRDTVALLHVSDTPFSLIDPPWDWTTLSAEFSVGAKRIAVDHVNFLALDPRVTVLPVQSADLASLGVKSYPIALEPFKFTEALIIANGGTGYGEIPFKLDPSNPSYVHLDNRLFRRLFGEFSPSRGDLVLSKTGELLGIMVTSTYCALVNNFMPSQVIRTGSDLSTRPTSKQLEDLNLRLRKLPQRLQ